jgi:hypothetical protein
VNEVNASCEQLVGVFAQLFITEIIYMCMDV